MPDRTPPPRADRCARPAHHRHAVPGGSGAERAQSIVDDQRPSATLSSSLEPPKVKIFRPVRPDQTQARRCKRRDPDPGSGERALDRFGDGGYRFGFGHVDVAAPTAPPADDPSIRAGDQRHRLRVAAVDA